MLALRWSWRVGAFVIGRVIFDVANDKRSHSPKTTEQGTIVECRLRTTNEEFEKACTRLRHILIPERITLTFNGQTLPSRSPVRTAEASLPTEYADENGDLRRTERKTRIDIYEVCAGEVAGIFELGIPVVDTGDVFHYDVRQRIPLPINRNNVHPSYLKRVRGAVLDATADLLTPEQAANKGVTDGIPAARPETRVTVLNARFGKKRYVTDFNREAGGELFAEGHTPVPPNAFDAETWKAIKDAGAIQSANQLRPKHYVASIPLPESQITPAMQKFRQFAEMVCHLTLNKSIVSWDWSNNPTASNAASCGPHGADAIVIGRERWGTRSRVVQRPAGDLRREHRPADSRVGTPRRCDGLYPRARQRDDQNRGDVGGSDAHTARLVRRLSLSHQGKRAGHNPPRIVFQVRHDEDIDTQSSGSAPAGF